MHQQAQFENNFLKSGWMDSQKFDPLEGLFEKKLKRKLEESSVSIAEAACPKKKKKICVFSLSSTAAESKLMEKKMHKFKWETVLSWSSKKK